MNEIAHDIVKSYNNIKICYKYGVFIQLSHGGRKIAEH